MKRLLVIRLGALGDLIHVSPSLEASKAADPNLEIHLLTSPAQVALASMMPSVGRVWLFEKNKGWQGLLVLAGQLRRAGITHVINLHPSLKSWLLVQLLQPIQSKTYHKQKLKVKGQAQRPLSRRHAVTDFYEPFRQLLNLPNASDLDLLPRLNLLAQPVNLPTRPATEQWIGLIPGVGAKRSNRAWEPDAYLRLVERLFTNSSVRILLIGGPDERTLAEQFMAELTNYRNRIENYCGQCDIWGTAHLLTQCDVVIGGDTGPMHLAAALGVPGLVGIYGPTSIQRTGPIGSQDIQLLTPPDELACWPCELLECPYTGVNHLACMKQISVEKVEQACLALLKNRH